MAKILSEEPQQSIKEQLSEEDILDMAKYIAYLENENKNLLEQLREAKAALVATVQQRNSLNAKLQNVLMDKQNVINIQSVPMQTNADLINPEQYRISEYKPQKK